MFRTERRKPNVQILTFDMLMRQTKVVLESRDDTLMLGRRFKLLADGERFLWNDDQDGWLHLYLYDRKGDLIRRLTKGQFAVMQIVNVDEANGWGLFFCKADTDTLRTAPFPSQTKWRRGSKTDWRLRSRAGSRESK